MNKEVSSAAVITIALVLVVLLIYLGIRAFSPPPSGGAYTPGVPPWKDPLQRSAYASGKAQPWRSANNWRPPGQSAQQPPTPLPKALSGQ